MPLISREFMEHRPQEIGQIKLGGRGRAHQTSGGGKSYIPEKFDHFKVVTRTRENGDGPFLLDEHVHSIVGAEPTELEGILMFPEVEQNLMTTMAHYAGRKPKTKCDGVVKTNQQGRESPCSRQKDGSGCKCRPMARLQLQLLASEYTGGYYVFRTRSWESVNNIQTSLEEIHARFKTLFMAPVKLLTYKSEDSYSQDGQDRVGRSQKVALVLNMDYERAAIVMAESVERLGAIRERLMLTAGEVQEHLTERDDEDAGEIADEFSPPRGVEASVATQERLEEVVEGLEPVGEPDGPDEPQDASEEPVEEVLFGATRGQVFDAREKCRELELLDSTAEQFVTDALASGDKVEMGKVLRALERKLGEGDT